LCARVTGPDGEARKYIAAMGPKTNTLGHFWRMVWENNCQAIVMTTNTVERGKDKCAVCVIHIAPGHVTSRHATSRVWANVTTHG
jgi:protein tyrosine phosphatase